MTSKPEDKKLETGNDARTLPAPEHGSWIFYDAGDSKKRIAGLGLRITASGARSWILNYRAAGQERRLTIGAYPTWTLDSARGRAKALRQDIDQGRDPLAEKIEKRDAPTVNELADRFLDWAKTEKRASSLAEDEALIRQWIRSELGNRKVAAIDIVDIEDLHRKISAKTPTRANRVRALLSKMFTLACTQWRSVYKIDVNPVKGSRRIDEHGRRRYPTAAEMPRLMAAVDGHANQQSADAIRLLALTGARRAEVLSATWRQFDLDAGMWSKPASSTKDARPHQIPLSRDAVALLRRMRTAAEAAVETFNSTRTVGQAKWEVSPFLFPVQRKARKGAEHVTTIKSAWAAICKAAEVTDLHLHDLRHGFASALVSKGQSLEVIGAMLGHNQPTTTQRYAHLYTDKLREAAEQVADVVKIR